MRVVVIGGWPRSLINFRGPLLRNLAELGHEVIAVAPDADKSVQGELRLLGARYINLPISRAGLNPYKDFQTFVEIRRLYQNEQPDIVLAYTAKPIIYSCLAAAAKGMPPVYAMVEGLGYAFGQESLKQRAAGVLVKLLYKIAMRRAVHVFFLNPDDQALFKQSKLISKGMSSSIINGTGLALDQWPPCPLPARVTFLMVARLLRDKGVGEYLEACRIVRAKHPNVRCLLVGDVDPNPMSMSVADINRWVDEGVVEYLGWQEDVRTYYAQSSVYVLPSYREGVPRTVLEAMAMGRPVITTDAPGCRETGMDGVNGFLVPIKNATALAEAMEKLINNPTLVARMGQESLRIAREKYDVRQVNEAIFAVMGI